MPIEEADLAALTVVAHGAGNTLRTAERAAAIGADVIEADLHLYRGRVEVRHLKIVRRAPFLLWDRWYLAPGWTKRLLLPEFAARIGATPGPAVMLDLKGHDAKITDAVLGHLEEIQANRDVWVCSPDWPLHEPLRDLPDLRDLQSIGTQPQLDAFLAGKVQGEIAGISIQRLILTADVLARLKERSSFVITWAVNDLAALDQVAAMGVSGISTDTERMLRYVIGLRRTTEPG
jgi:glycerophosphoryl diester phosphodiesterase